MSDRFQRRLSSQGGRAMAGTSRVNREVYARFCGRLEGKFLPPTRRPVPATALTATVGDATVFESGRHLAAWLGLVPRQNSSGGKERLGGISRAGDGYLRRLLVHGARSVMRWHGKTSPWLAGL